MLSTRHQTRRIRFLQVVKPRLAVTRDSQRALIDLLTRGGQLMARLDTASNYARRWHLPLPGNARQIGRGVHACQPQLEGFLAYGSFGHLSLTRFLCALT
eukprot:scaffold241994_cov26-Tisochrysis_lutea.AAC.4